MFAVINSDQVPFGSYNLFDLLFVFEELLVKFTLFRYELMWQHLFIIYFDRHIIL